MFVRVASRRHIGALEEGFTWGLPLSRDVRLLTGVIDQSLLPLSASIKNEKDNSTTTLHWYFHCNYGLTMIGQRDYIYLGWSVVPVENDEKYE